MNTEPVSRARVVLATLVHECRCELAILLAVLLACLVTLALFG